MRTLLAVALVSLLLPGVAQAADPSFEAALSPERIVFGAPDPDARLTVRTGDEAETFHLTANGAAIGYPSFAGPDRDFGLLGTSCATRPRAEGPATFGPTACAVPSIAACTRTNLPVYHGRPNGSTRFEVTIPPRSTSTIVLPLEHADTAPWPGSRYQASFAVSGGTLEESRVVTGPVTAPAGRTGARIELAVEPAGAEGCAPTPKVSGPLTVRGRADPELIGQEVILRTATDTAKDPVELARVRVGEDGTFAYRDWRPPPGYREVGALYRSQRAQLTDDFARPVAFERQADPDRPGPGPGPGPGPAPDAPPEPAPGPAPGSQPPGADPPGTASSSSSARLVNRRLRADRRGIVRLRLRCPAGAARPCAGPLRIAAGGRTLAARSATLVPGRTRTVRVRLRRSARARVAARPRPLRVRVRIGSAPAVTATLERR